jgi:predicted branched-subunit amino acid permease
MEDVEHLSGAAHGEGLRAGARGGLPFAMAGFLVAASFGVLAKPVLGVPATWVMSAFVFAGSAQFAALAVLASGGGALTAILAGVLLNLRFVPMGIAIAPSLRHGPVGRAVRGQALVDASWALANRGEGRFDISALLGATAVQYVTWVSGTIIGLVIGSALGDPKSLGLDAIFPAFFLGLLAAELRRPGTRLTSVVGAGVALLLTPVLPAGVPILAAALAAGIGRRQ